MSEFGSLSDASAAALSALESPAPASPAPVADTPTASATPADPTNPSAPHTPPETNIPDFKGTRHKVKVRGTEEEVEYDELVKGYSRQADYTRAKQELADQVRQAREMEQAIRAQQDSLQQIFGSDPLLSQAAQVAQAYNVPFNQALQAVLQYQQQQEQIPQGVQSPTDQLASVEQARAIAQAQLAQVQSQMALLQRQLEEQMTGRINAAKTEIETSHQAQAYASEVNTTLSDIFAKNPVLKAVDGMEDLLRFKVYQSDPATVEEAKDLFVRFAQEQAERLNQQFIELNKDRLTAKEKLVSGGIEPPGGAGITPQPTQHKFGSQELRNSAEDYLRALMR